MATETVASHPTSTMDEQVEKKVEEVEKAIDNESISSSKEKEEENSNKEDSPSPAPTTVEPQSVEDKQIEQPLVAEVPKTTVVAPENDAPVSESKSCSSAKENEEETPKAESSPSPATPSSISEATENKPIEPPAAVEAEKAADAPVPVESHSAVSSTKVNEEEKNKPEDKAIESPKVEVEKASDNPVMEVPAIESQSVSSTKGNEEEKSKADHDVSIPEKPSPEPEDIKEKLIEQPHVVEAEKASSDGPASVVEVEHVSANTEVDNSHTTEKPSLQSGGAEEKQVEVEETVDAPISNVPQVNETTTTEKDIDLTATTGPELANDSVKNQIEAETTCTEAEGVVKEATTTQPSEDVVEKVQEEQPKIVDVHEPSIETIDKSKETLEPSPVHVEPEAITLTKEIEEPKPGSVVVEKPDAVAEVEEKRVGETLEVAEQVEKNEENIVEEEIVEDKATKEEKTLADKVEDSTSLKVAGTEKDGPPNSTENTEASTEQPAKSDLKDEGNYSAPIVKETVVGEEDKKEASKVEVVDKTSKDVSLELEKVVEEKGNVITDQGSTTQLSVPKDEVNDNSFKKDERDVEPVEENKTAATAAEKIKDETPTSAEETKKDEKVEEVVTSTENKPLEESEPKQLDEEEKKKETVKTEAKELKNAEEADIAKSDQNPEAEPPTKEDDHTKDEPKEVPTKPTQKQSNNLISKMKQSLVKAKKAIIGKSPNSKTPASEAKGDIKVK